MKSQIKRLLFGSTIPRKIWSGVSSGMLTGYGPANRSLHLMGIYEREIYSYLRKGMLRSSVLVDIGANDGYYALAFMRYPNKKVILCEPGEERFDLMSNLRLNGFEKDRDYTLVDKFVTARSGPHAVTIESLILPGEEHFILMDIEGAELEVIDDFDFGGHRINWLIETHAMEIETKIAGRLRQNNYKVHIIDQAWWRLFFPEHRPLLHNRWLYAERN